MQATSEVFTALKIQVNVFCVVTQCSVAVEYQRFGGSCVLRLQGYTSNFARVKLSFGSTYTRRDVNIFPYFRSILCKKTNSMSSNVAFMLVLVSSLHDTCSH